MLGRAGREKLPGQVIIQTYNPENYCIEYAKMQNYDLFYNTEIRLREQLKYPPFCDIVIIRFISENEKNISELSNIIYKYLKTKLLKHNFSIFEPMPSPIDRIQKNYRWRIILKGNVTEEVNKILNDCLKQFYQIDKNKVKISIDINPNNMI